MGGEGEEGTRETTHVAIEQGVPRLFAHIRRQAFWNCTANYTANSTPPSLATIFERRNGQLRYRQLILAVSAKLPVARAAPGIRPHSKCENKPCGYNWVTYDIMCSEGLPCIRSIFQSIHEKYTWKALLKPSQWMFLIGRRGGRRVND